MSRLIRIYYPFLPYPVIEGGYQVALDQASSLVRLGHRVELVVWKDPVSQLREKRARLERTPLGSRLRVLPVGESLEDRPSGSHRWRSGETLARRGLRVVGSLFSRWASPEIFHYPLASDPAGRLPPADVGIYHYSFAYPWLKQRPQRPERKVVVHLHNLESDLARIRAPVSGPGLLSVAGWMHRLNSRKLRLHEVELYRLAHELWFVSAVDHADYAEMIGSRERLRLVPPTYDPGVITERKQIWLERLSQERNVCLGFIGTLDFEPNRLSLEWIIEHLTPLLARRGFTGKIVVAGRGVTHQLRAAGDRYGFFEWCGFLPSLEDFWARLSFLLVPHLQGSGTRIKLLEALASGVPVLANGAAVAALRADVQRLPLLTVRDDPAEWAERILAEAEPYQTRRRHADQDLKGSNLDGAVVYRFVDETGDRSSLSRTAANGVAAAELPGDR